MTFSRGMAVVAATLLALAPAVAQVRTVDPNQGIDSDLGPTTVDRARSGQAPATGYPQSSYPQQGYPQQGYPQPGYQQPNYPPPNYEQSTDPAPEYRPAQPMPYSPPPAGQPADPSRPAVPVDNTYNRDDILGAAERTFGKGAAGLAEIVEKTLKEQGRPNAYIAGSEGSGAVVVGLRYGSGTLSHKIEGERKVHWTGPSVGFDVGGDANKVFMLVYNLYDSEDLYKRFPAGEGRLYFIGGFAATYLRWKDVVIIPIRLGVGYRAGVNAGYLKFTKKGTVIPF